jgi:uncharacterized membrane protein YbhN (UPF0104 family)
VEKGYCLVELGLRKRVVERELAVRNARYGGGFHAWHRTFGAVVPAADIGESFRSFFDAVDSFVSNLASVGLLSLLISLACFTAYLSLRAFASFNILRAAYPTERIRFREIWGSYFAGYGFNAVIPARGGDVVRLFLTKTSVPHASYPAVAATFVVELGFDIAMGSLILIFAFTQGVFPKPPDFADLNAFDLSYLAQHPRFALFLLTSLAVAVLAAFALLSVRVKAFWERVKQGFTILSDRRLYLRQVFAVQFVAWLFRFAAFWALLEAFNVGGSVENVLLVLGVNAVSAAVPFTPQGAGVQQALLAKVFSGTAAGSTVAAYSVGQQIAIGALTFGIGFAALVFIFRVRSFKEVIARGKQDRAEEAARREPEPRDEPAGL